MGSILLKAYYFFERQDHIRRHMSVNVSRSTESDPFVQRVTNDDVVPNNIRIY